VSEQQIRAYLVAQFPRPTSPGIDENGDSVAAANLAIEGYEGAVPADGNVHLVLFPADLRIQLVSNIGEIQRGDIIPIFVPGGTITFSGSQSVSLPRRPQYSSPTLTTLFAFDENGLPTTANIRTDAFGQVVSDKKIYAAIAYTDYVTSGQRFTYRPVTNNLPGGGTTKTFGVIAAFFPPTKEMLIYQVQPVDINTGDWQIELYRLVSYSVATPEGEYELPPNYPTDGNYPGSTTIIDPATSLKTQRVHEVGFMDANGRGYSRTYTVQTLRPYDSDTNYKPVKTCITTPPGGNISPALKQRALNLIAGRGFGCQ